MVQLLWVLVQTPIAESWVFEIGVAEGFDVPLGEGCQEQGALGGIRLLIRLRLSHFQCMFVIHSGEAESGVELPGETCRIRLDVDTGKGKTLPCVLSGGVDKVGCEPEATVVGMGFHHEDDE